MYTEATIIVRVPSIPMLQPRERANEIYTS
jgi:hypothetical protein